LKCGTRILWIVYLVNLGKVKLTKKIVQIEFVIDDLRAEKIANRLYNEFYGRKGIFKECIPPEYVLPSRMREGSREHALFLTYVISINYMIDSAQLWKKARGAYALFPDRFTPERILKSGPKNMETFVKFLGARNSATAAKTWMKISEILVNNYQGDPRNITKEPLRVQDIQGRLKAFPYLKGSKLSSYYIRVMGESGLFKIKNLNQLNIPVDRQVACFTINSGVLDMAGKHFAGFANEEPLKGIVEEVWRNAAKSLGIAPWKLHEPISLVESSLCGNRKCKQCPVEDHCEKKRQGITFRENVLFWRKMR